MSTRREVYETYLQSEHWQNLRMLALINADEKCEACGSKNRLHGHHIRYRDPLESCTPDDIMALCAPCHDKFHDWLKEKKKRPEYFNRTDTITRIMILSHAPKTPRPKKEVTVLVVKDGDDWKSELTPQMLTAYDHALTNSAPHGGHGARHNHAINCVQRIFKVKLKHLKIVKNKMRGYRGFKAPQKEPKKSAIELRVDKLEETVQKLVDELSRFRNNAIAIAS